jgi:hypothetical protein
MQKFGATFYAETLIALLTRPAMFFANRFAKVSTSQAAGILIVSGLFFAATGSLLNPASASLTTGLILFINAIGMVAMGSVIGYLALFVTADRRYPFSHLFNVFSLSSGAVLLIAWVPSAFLLTEPWKWWLIGTGMVNGLGMTKTRAVIIVLFTFSATVIVVYSLLPVAHWLACHSI